MWKPSELVFVLIAVTACIAFVSGILEPKDFMLLSGMAFGFYFGKPNNPTDQLGGK